MKAIDKEQFEALQKRLDTAEVQLHALCSGLALALVALARAQDYPAQERVIAALHAANTAVPDDAFNARGVRNTLFAVADALQAANYSNSDALAADFAESVQSILYGHAGSPFALYGGYVARKGAA